MKELKEIYKFDWNRILNNDALHIEYSITDVCNRSCKSCSHLAPLAKEANHVSIEEFERITEILHKCLPDIHTFWLTGGEPTLHPRFKRLLEIAREIYTKSYIGIYTNGMTLNKNEKDETFWKKEAPDYCFQSLYLQNEDELGDALECEELDGIRTIVTRESQTSDEPIVSFAREEVTLQRATGDGVNHTFMDDFRQRCIQTALGYSNTVWDLLAAAYPEKKDDAWEILSKEAASNICTYQKPFTAFDETTISKSDQRIRRFLALSYSAESEDNMISLHVDGLEEEAWFLLHTGTREAEDIQGGSFSVVEDGVYLICAEEDEVKIRLSEEEEKQLFYYED